MDIVQAISIFIAAALGGALNSVAGGGSFISFPTLLLFHPGLSIQCNATNTVALWPGSVASAGAYREELSAQRHVLLILGGASLVGGLAGAELLVHTKSATFDRILPWLMLAATLLFTFGPAITRSIRSRSVHVKTPSGLAEVGIAIAQLVIAVYGGFFGGGIGILMLATLSLMGMEEIHTMNALKTVLASLINGIAVVLFIAHGKVLWAPAVVMVVGAVLGGYLGAHYARRMPAIFVRRFVIAVGFAMTIIFFARL